MLILASQSPRRREILANAGIDFVVRVANVPEYRSEGEDPIAYVHRLAASKAAAIDAGPDDIVLGADTVVVVDEEVLEKPEDDRHATEMLRKLSARNHEVITGICLRRGSETIVDHAMTRVVFEPLSEDMIAEYVRSGEPVDKAGGYAIQGLASKFISRIEGCYFNVVGLPISLVYRHLEKLREAVHRA